MATRVTTVGTLTAGSFESAANYNDAAGGAIAYGKATTPQTGVTTAVDVTGCTTGAYTYPGGRLYAVVGYIPALIQNTSNSTVKCRITDGANATQAMVADVSVTAGSRVGGNIGMALVAPAAGSTTYKLRLETGSGTVDTSAGVAGAEPGPAFIVVIDLGPSF